MADFSHPDSTLIRGRLAANQFIFKVDICSKKVTEYKQKALLFRNRNYTFTFYPTRVV